MKRLAIAFAIFLTGCAPAQQWTPKEEVSTGEYRLPIIETTDIHGQWTADWKSRSLILAVSEFLATSERTDRDTQLENPLREWNNMARLLSNSDVDNENAVRVLREEAKASGGHLYIDNKPYFILAD